MDKLVLKTEHNTQSNTQLTSTPSECWICMSSGTEALIRPCKCKGSTKHVHPSCFKSFISNKSIKTIHCSFCKHKYIVTYKNAHFLAFYSILQQINHVASTLLFIFVLMLIFYSVMFIYGFSVLILFAGYKNVKDYMACAAILFMGGKCYTMCKLCYAAPLIPLMLVMSTYSKFKLGPHVMCSIVMVDTLNPKWLLIYFLPLVMFTYKSNMNMLQRKLGRVESIRNGVTVNEHQFDLRSLGDVLTCPFIGVLFSNVLWIRDRVWRYLVGIGLYMLVKDMGCVYFLICDRKRLDTMVVQEVNDDDNNNEQIGDEDFNDEQIGGQEIDDNEEGRSGTNNEISDEEGRDDGDLNEE